MVLKKHLLTLTILLFSIGCSPLTPKPSEPSGSEPSDNPPVKAESILQPTLLKKVINSGNPSSSCLAEFLYRHTNEKKSLFLQGSMIHGLNLDENGNIEISRSESRDLSNLLAYHMRFEGVFEFNSSQVSNALTRELNKLDGKPCSNVREVEKSGEVIGELFISDQGFAHQRNGNATFLL